MQGLESMYNLAQKCMKIKPVSGHHKLIELLIGILGENPEVRFPYLCCQHCHQIEALLLKTNHLVFVNHSGCHSRMLKIIWILVRCYVYFSLADSASNL